MDIRNLTMEDVVEAGKQVTGTVDEGLDRMYRYMYPSEEQRKKVALNYLLRKAGVNVRVVQHDLEIFKIRRV